MTDEEKEAIKELNKFSNSVDMSGITSKEGQIILNLIEKQQKEIERTKTFLNVSNEIFKIDNSMLDKKDLEIEKRDKIIDLMAQKIYEEEIIWHNKEEVKGYFEEML